MYYGVSVSVEYMVLSNQALSLPSSQNCLVRTTNLISSAADNTRKITTKYKAEMYRIVAATIVLSATLSDSISILPVFLIGRVAIVCTGHRAVQYCSLVKILSDLFCLQYQKLRARRSLLQVKQPSIITRFLVV
jgi:hypothetical protein